MGARNAKVATYSIPIIVKRLGQVDLPEDRNIALDLMSQIDAQLLNPKTLDIYSKQLKNCNGIQMIIKITKSMIEDIDAVSTFAQIVETVKLNVSLMMDFIQFGGLDVLEKILRTHEKDNYLQVMVPKLMKVVLAVGATSSIQEIEHEAVNLKLCQCCQETIERAKSRMGSAAHIVLPKSSDRVNRVLRFMDNYLPRVDVQVAALDAIINFARNADSARSSMETDVVEVVAKSIEKHIDEDQIIWRGCMAFAILASYQQEVAVEIVMTNVHETMIDRFSKYKAQPLIQQQILWLISALLQWPRSHRMLHKSLKCVNFVKFLIEKFQEAQNLHASALSEGGNGEINLNQLLGHGDDDEGDEYRPRVDLPLAIPIKLRIFLRETGGKTYKKPKETKTTPNENKVIKLRRNYDERPRFGTVSDKLFTKGDGGLLPGENEDEDGNEKAPAPDWEQALDNLGGKQQQQ